MTAPVWAEAVPGDQEIVDAIHIDITPSGFDVLGAIVPALAPADLPVEDLSEGTSGFKVELSGLAVDLTFDDIQITPNTGYLDVEIDLLVAVNSSGDPFNLYTEALWIPSDCDGWVDPFPVTAHTTIAIELIEYDDGPPIVDATIGEFEVDFELTGDDAHIEGGFLTCAVGTTLDALSFFGLDIVKLIVDSLGDTLDTVIADLAPEIETALEDAFSAAVIDQSIELQGSQLDIKAHPGDITIRSQGMRISMNGSATTPDVNPCVEDWDDGTFQAVLSDPPEIGSTPSDIPSGFGAGLLVSDDFGHQAMYALWRSGLLCYTVDEDLGFPIDTSLLGLLAGDAFNELFPDARPMVIVTRPKQPPTMNFVSEHDIGLKVNELGLDFMGELDHRMARVLAMDLEVDAGVDLNFDGSTGNLGIAIDLGEDSITPTVSSNDFAPDSSDTIEASFGSVFNGLVGGLLGDALGDLSFSVPGFEGIGLTELQFSSAGAEQDWLGGYAWLGEVEYASTGCSEDGSGGCGEEGGGGCGEEGGGCGDVEGAGCEGGGCTTAPRNQRRWLWLLFPTFLIALRRRE
jgi:hypothetical protein